MSDKFYQNTHDWAYSLYQSQGLWCRRLLCAVIILSAFLLISLLTNLFLFPLKQNVPYLYSFNHATGQITKIGTLQPAKLNTDWEMTRFFIIRYVVNRESYDYDNINYPYQVAWLMSDNAIQKEYDSQVQSTILTSPYKLYGKTKFITVHVNSINPLNSNTAEVQFEKTCHDKDAGTIQTSACDAIIKWKYEKENNVTQRMLDRDPLGFKVIYYKQTQVNLK